VWIWGRDNDYTALVVIDATTQQMVAIDRYNQIEWDFQRKRLAHLARHWGVSVIWAESNSIGSVNIEELQKQNLPIRAFQTTAKTKPPLIEALSLAIERGDLQLLPHEVLLHELAQYTMHRTATGHYQYSAPSGGHDDTVIATALAWHGANNSGLRVDFA